MAKKFIINDGCLIIGEVPFASMLVRDHSKTTGGGLWHYDHTQEILYFYGSSLDFGPVSKEQIESACLSNMSAKKIMWCEAGTLEEALRLSIPIIPKTVLI